MSDHNGNGHKRALAFSPPKGIPLVGQPFTIKGWFPTVLLTCNCEGKEPVMIPRGGAAQCPACKNIYTIRQIQAPAGVNFGIGVTSAEEVQAMADAGNSGGLLG